MALRIAAQILAAGQDLELGDVGRSASANGDPFDSRRLPRGLFHEYLFSAWFTGGVIELMTDKLHGMIRFLPFAPAMMK